MGFDYGYFSDILRDTDMVLGPMKLLFNGLTSAIAMLSGLASYILFGLAVMIMGQKLRLRYPWLSWIPFASSYAFGKIAETPDKPRRTGATLLTLRILTAALGLLATVSAVFTGVFAGVYYAENGSGFPVTVAVFAGVTLLLLLGMAGVAIAYTVIYYMAFSRITRLFAGEKYLTYFLLGFIPVFFGLSVATPVVLMVLSSREPAPEAFPYGFDQFGNIHSNDPEQ